MRAVIHYKFGSYLPLTENWIYGQIKYLRRYKPIVYAHGTENLDMYPMGGIKIRSLEVRERLRDPLTFFNKGCHRIFKFYPFFAIYLAIDRPKLIHAHFGPSGYEFLKLKTLYKIPQITTFYGYDMSLLPSQDPHWKTKYKELFAEGDLFLSEGSYMKDRLIGLGCPPEKVEIQRIAIKIGEIPFRTRKSKNGGDVIVLFAGRFSEKKGLLDALQAVYNVWPYHRRIQFRIIGDGPLMPKAKAFIAEHQMMDYVRMLGLVDHSKYMKELYDADIFLAPSLTALNGDSEGGAPTTILEAQATGLPIISTYHADIPNIVVPNGSALLVPEHDVSGISHALMNLIDGQTRWKQMGQIGRRHVEQYHDIETEIAGLERKYSSLLNES
jgi:colanic acid/amylovoran biosynthesis glycosyltransferase